MQKKILVLSTLLTWNVLAWGPLGHRTAGLIADANLTPQAKSAVAQLLGNQTLADTANWADSLKSGTTYPQARSYHYENIPDGTPYLNNLSNMPPAQRAKGGAVQAIMAARDILRSNARIISASDKSDALKFMNHFIGDLHQPLHTGRPEDLGGNKISLVWFGTAMNLHQLWDSGLIMTGHADIINPQQSLEQASLIYAQYLVKAYGKRVIFTTSDLEIWTNESMNLRSGAYDTLYQKDQRTYQMQRLPQIDQRILMAGLRLADTLNHIFAGAQPPPEELNFRQQVERIIGNIHNIISLRP